MSEPSLTERLLKAKTVWDKHYSALPSTLRTPQGTNVPKESIEEWWGKSLREIEIVENEGGIDHAMKSYHWPNVTSHVQQLESHMNSVAANGASWLGDTNPTLQGYLYGIITSTFWLVPFSVDGLTKAGAQRVAELTQLGDQIRELATQSIQVNSEITERSEEAKASWTTIKDHVAQAESVVRSVEAAATNATAGAAATEAEKSKAEDSVKELLGAVAKQATLFKEFEDKRDLVESTIEGASKVGLANSFRSRRRMLGWTQLAWALVFVAGIVGLTCAGWLAWEAMKTALDPKNKDLFNGTFLWANLSRYVLLAPIIWLTWFAARQYGHALRLAEDYAFKEAAALAFVGYRNEMGEDDDMLKLLREYAIKNFGANPVRVLANDDPVTPVNAALERALEKVNPDKLLDLIKDALASKK